MSARRVLKLTGADHRSFLQNLVTNDVDKLSDGLVWTALLTPQGKYLADFFLVPSKNAVLIDVAEALAAGVKQRLAMYRLRADVQIEETELEVARGMGAVPDGAFADPRHESLGWRAYDGRSGQTVDWDSIRVALGVPETGVELIPNETYPLEMSFDELNGVDFSKGCYVGQEVTARMKHKTELRKGLARVQLDGMAKPGEEIFNGKGAFVGTIHTVSEDKALAYLRFDRIDDSLRAGDAHVTVISS